VVALVVYCSNVCVFSIIGWCWYMCVFVILCIMCLLCVLNLGLCLLCVIVCLRIKYMLFVFECV